MREQRDLHVRRTRVLGVRLECVNRLCLRFHIYERENLPEFIAAVKEVFRLFYNWFCFCQIWKLAKVCFNWKLLA
jgi:hypothetical protein